MQKTRILSVQDTGDLKRTADRAEAADAALASRSRILEATLSSIPDYVYAFDRDRRFAYANPAMLNLFGLSPEDMLGRTFVELGYPAELAARLDGHIDQILKGGATVEDEVFYRSPTGHAPISPSCGGPLTAKTAPSSWWSAYRERRPNDARSRRS